MRVLRRFDYLKRMVGNVPSPPPSTRDGLGWVGHGWGSSGQCARAARGTIERSSRVWFNGPDGAAWAGQGGAGLGGGSNNIPVPTEILSSYCVLTHFCPPRLYI